jgi:hypothetical protein
VKYWRSGRKMGFGRGLVNVFPFPIVPSAA